MNWSYLSNLNRSALLPYVGHPDQMAGIKLMEAGDGLARGSRMFQVWTGSGLSFNVLADRALDISACHYRGISLAWTSPVGDVHPAYYEPEDVGWLRSFQGGLLVTGGLDQFGYPCSDEGEAFGLHGRISNLPARYVNHRAAWQGDQYELEITGEVRQARVFGENLVLRRRISTALGSNKIRLTDVVTNEGFVPQPHMILYHFNLGFPLLSESTHLRVEVEKTVPRDAEAKNGLDNWMNFQPPTEGYQEQVFHHTPAANEAGQVKVEVENPALGLGLRWTYAKENLPHLFEWKMMGRGTYVLGVEPANSSGMHGRAAARADNDLPELMHGESCRYELEFEVFELS
jgi:hypothetical protein